MLRLIAVTALLCLFSGHAQADPELRLCPGDQTYRQTCGQAEKRLQSHRTGRAAYHEAAVVGGRPDGCPRRYCGCGVSLKVFGRIIPELNLAANWVRKFSRTSPAAGMVAARRGHVFYILSYLGDGTALAYDPNSGRGKTRIHERSLAGYVVVNPYARVASR